MITLLALLALGLLIVVASLAAIVVSEVRVSRANRFALQAIEAEATAMEHELAVWLGEAA